MLELIVDTPQNLKEFTDNTYAQASFYYHALIKNREIKVNGKRVGGDIPLFPGDVVTYYLTKKQEEKPAFHTVYEDENVLIVDKEDGVNSEAVYAALSRLGEYYFIHRLDRNTRGLLSFAKNTQAEAELLRAFKTHTAQKTYHARCFGCPQKPSAVLTDYLQKDGGMSLVKVISKPIPGAEKIVTEYKVLETFGEQSLLEITLHTGKTHQIRAHLAYIGCPIVGDMKYGNTAKNKALSCARQQLISKTLTFHFEGKLSYLNSMTFTSTFDFKEKVN
jgi:23S rRNA pseudouridine955/2504/2580 synthase